MPATTCLCAFSRSAFTYYYSTFAGTLSPINHSFVGCMEPQHCNFIWNPVILISSWVYEGPTIISLIGYMKSRFIILFRI